MAAPMNPHYLELQGSYLFAQIAQKAKAFLQEHPDKDLIRLGIGDVTEPLPAACVDAMHAALEEMRTREGFHGYGPEQGYAFLRERIAAHEYASLGIDKDEIFISTGAKEDTGNFQELFGPHARVAVMNPVYPVYVDTNVMAGRSGVWHAGAYSNLVYLDANEDNAFQPDIPREAVDVVYLCYPNNPTGQSISRERLQKWVDYARKEQVLLLYDAAYRAFIQDPEKPRSIYEIPGAQEVAVEFNSFSKSAGFTGMRCAYTVVPKALSLSDAQGQSHSLRDLWARRQTTKFNGVSYVIQRGAEAVYTPEGQQQVQRLIQYYLQNARIIREALSQKGCTFVGGEDSPYIWMRVPQGMSSWEYFDRLLQEVAVLGTPGVGFGGAGEGYFRFSAFGLRERVQEAMDRFLACSDI